ncbi:unnamed protein product [Ambrosiozyma monospora]|uniref:Unnamed protein product n=1 Tax=Ambrosiozyma monospora TaxID=43982 RepID=A0A9W6T5A5_AMBMO|nr:unnamed protein product [Ambrosiozyma monospora]
MIVDQIVVAGQLVVDQIVVAGQLVVDQIVVVVVVVANQGQQIISTDYNKELKSYRLQNHTLLEENQTCGAYTLD